MGTLPIFIVLLCYWRQSNIIMLLSNSLTLKTQVTPTILQCSAILSCCIQQDKMMFAGNISTALLRAEAQGIFRRWGGSACGRLCKASMRPLHWGFCWDTDVIAQENFVIHPSECAHRGFQEQVSTFHYHSKCVLQARVHFMLVLGAIS